ncbi:MAG: hypothetical protein GXP54_00240 [Deltaproteobacteria bacterium]|nr:hypothetical protein [Deltaproteobacteria bacterium]
MVEIPTADTVETLAASLSLPARFRQAVMSNLPWTIASLCALMVVILLVVFLPDYLKLRTHPTNAPAQVAAAVKPGQPHANAATTRRPAIDAGPALAKARDLLEQKDIDAAEHEVDRVLAANPADADAVRLRNIITMERKAEKSLTASMDAVTRKDYASAAQSLLQIPADSIFHEQCVSQLGEFRIRIDKDRKRICRRKGRKSVDCIRLTALLAKINDSITTPDETPRPPSPAGP